MNDEPIQPLPYLKLLLLAALLGLISAGITFVFMALVNGVQSLVWEEAATVGLSAPIFTLLICTLGQLIPNSESDMKILIARQ